MFDTIIKSATIVDGTGAEPFIADLGLIADRIAGVGDLSQSVGGQTVDGHGKWLTPGFIDVHTHMDGWLLKNPLIESKLRQGFTTEVIMSDGISYAPVSKGNAHQWILYLRGLNALEQCDYTGWESISEYMDLLDGRNAQNVLTQIPYANVRVLTQGWTTQPLDDFQQLELNLRIERDMAAGACGLSTGIDYISQCFATTEELRSACEPVAAAGGLYATHVRYKKGTLIGVKEAVELGRQTGVKIHISHLKGNSIAERDQLLAYITDVAMHEVDFTFDVYPYVPGSTMLNYLIPYSVYGQGPVQALHALRSRRIRDAVSFMTESQVDLSHISIAWVPSKVNTHWQGRTLQEFVEASPSSPGDTLCDFLIEENLAVLLVFHRGDDLLVEEFLQHPAFLLGTDGIYQDGGHVHPRQFGSTTRILDTLVSKGVLTLQKAVHAMTGKSATRFGMKDRGTLKEGKFADMVLIEPNAFKEQNSFQQPAILAKGVDHLWVNGTSVIADGKLMDPLSESNGYPGRSLKFKA